MPAKASSIRSTDFALVKPNRGLSGRCCFIFADSIVMADESASVVEVIMTIVALHLSIERDKSFFETPWTSFACSSLLHKSRV